MAVLEAAVVAELLPVIGGKENDRLLGFGKTCQQATDLTIHVGDLALVELAGSVERVLARIEYTRVEADHLLARPDDEALVELVAPVRVGAALLDLDDPSKVIGRLDEPLLEPTAPYEAVGLVPNVVYPCGAVELNNEFLVYYGGADAVTGVASIGVDELLGAF